MNIQNKLENLDDIEKVLSDLVEAISSHNASSEAKTALLNSFNESFEKLEQEKVKQKLLERKVNFLMKELKEEMQALLVKHSKLEKFEAQVEKHFNLLNDIKSKTPGFVENDKEEIVVLFNNYRKVSKFIGEELKQELVIENIIKDEIDTAILKLQELKRHL